MSDWRLVIVESPYSGDVEANLRYLRAVIADCVRRGESPYASHLMLTGALDDDVPAQRAMGIAAGFAWRRVAAATVVYVDRGVSRGMQAGVEDAEAAGLPVEVRRLGGDW